MISEIPQAGQREAQSRQNRIPMKVLVIGSGPIVIGQAAEFDYAGTQACKSLKEEGHEVVLINSNPATIMTDPDVSDRLYIEPLTPDFCERVIARERPDALLPTLGGQTGLNLATQLADRGILEKYEVRLLGTPLSAIRKAEDRELFRALMREIREPVPESFIVENEAQLKALLPTQIPDEHGRLIEFPYPRIVRPAYTLGGTGGGIAHNPDELWDIGRKGLKLSMRSQLMIERSLLGWKEIEYEVMRDSAGNCITVCNMENFDPMGVHTGDSIVVAPSQTLSDIEYHMLRTASLKIIQSLGIEGGCNVQLAVNPESFDYYVIEVNPRVSRSSALASKATGYPIARVAAKIAVGKTLDEIENQVTKTTKACFEPALDYVVVKIPRWPFDKFSQGDRSLFTQMKATGEVMAIDRTFESALLKAIRGLEVRQKDLRHEKFGGSGAGIPVERAKESGSTVPVERAIKSGSTVSVEGESHGEGDPDSTGTIEPPRQTSEIQKRKGAYLPHWTKPGATYAINFRQADSLPREKRELLQMRKAEFDDLVRRGALSEREKREYRESFPIEVDKYLDQGAGSCLLKKPEVADLVESALKHFDGNRYRLHAWAIMPNHVHAVIEPLVGFDLPQILHSWKSFTAHEIKKLTPIEGDVWFDEGYDHLVRDHADYDHAVRYVLENPGSAGLISWRWVGRGPYEFRLSEDALAESSVSPGHDRDGHATPPMPDDELRLAIQNPTDERLWAICEGLRRGWSVEEVNRLCRVDPWFLNKLVRLIEIESDLVAGAPGSVERALEAGFSPQAIADLGASVPEGDAGRVFKMVDTCAGEFESKTPYFYGAWEKEDDAVRSPA